MKILTGKVVLGITEDEVALGSHLIHFWQNKEEFERGVRFLELGIENESQYCVLFVHDEANQEILENAGFGAHDLAVWGHALTQNAYFAPREEAKRNYRAAL
jgi:hypothetical protein